MHLWVIYIYRFKSNWLDFWFRPNKNCIHFSLIFHLTGYFLVAILKAKLAEMEDRAHKMTRLLMILQLLTELFGLLLLLWVRSAALNEIECLNRTDTSCSMSLRTWQYSLYTIPCNALLREYMTHPILNYFESFSV